jgi:hypothetical protein
MGGYVPVSPAAYAGRPAPPFLRRSRAPIVVDAPGVAVRVTDGAGEAAHELVHWETITELVVSPATSGPRQRRVDTVGLRLRADPGGVRHRQVVDGWRYERPALEAAVARFAGARVGVGEETPPPPGFVYLARPALRPRRETMIIAGSLGLFAAGQAALNGLPVGVAAVLLLVAAPFVIVARVVRRLPTVSLRVSAEGILFGPGPGGPSTAERHVWWPEIEAVVLFTVEGDPERRPAVGVRTGVPPRITTYRVARGWRLDTARLQAAVRAHRPHLPIEQLGPVPPGALPGAHS